MRQVTAKSVKAFSLLELLIASVIMVILIGASFSLLRTGLGASSTTVTQGIVQERARGVVEALAREMKDTGEQCTGWEVGLDPDPVSQHYGQDVSKISFSRCVGYDPALEMLQWGSVVTYEHEPAQGEEPGKLVRTEGGAHVTVCDHVTEFAVCYQPDESAVVITLTVQRESPESRGHFISASYATTVKLRN